MVEPRIRGLTPSDIERLGTDEGAGSSPASPASDSDCKAIIDAVIDYNFDQVLHKMEVHNIDFDMALQMQLAVIMAGAE